MSRAVCVFARAPSVLAMLRRERVVKLISLSLSVSVCLSVSLSDVFRCSDRSHIQAEPRIRLYLLKTRHLHQCLHQCYASGRGEALQTSVLFSPFLRRELEKRNNCFGTAGNRHQRSQLMTY